MAIEELERRFRDLEKRVRSMEESFKTPKEEYCGEEFSDEESSVYTSESAPALQKSSKSQA